MNLTDEQIAKVTAWIDAGAGLNAIQERLRDELAITITYLETRFLLADLGLEIKESAEPDEPAEAESPEPDAQAEFGGAGDDDANALGADDPLGGGGGVQVTVDQIAQPGAAVSGKVTFADGKRAAWYLTEFGELGLNPDEAGYQPAQSDVAAFQRELQNVLRREGF